ncbi:MULTISPECIES: YaaC family protein [Streptacidiphilus]|uniref:YaaC family protein n=1 Tax=Streptacidiphilus cavernicola TaxID=3342716 RepID=A0ABV6URD9_9ACTN|nr:YaaC family protein [Streptacidiphilus jeojiense]
MPAILQDPVRKAKFWSESASFPLLLENLRRHAEIAEVGRARFPGTLAQKNKAWREYRNFLRQALSNYTAAIDVPNRSACLLYYYAMLNFAKAELLSNRPNDISGKFVGHGLSFSPKRAQTVAGDVLEVKEGVFRWLYEERTGHSLPKGTRLSVKRLLAQIPEVGTQVADAGLGECQIVGANISLAMDSSNSWTMLLVQDRGRGLPSRTEKILLKSYRQVRMVDHWRDIFAISKRALGNGSLYESLDLAPNAAPAVPNFDLALANAMKIRDIVGMRTDEFHDFMICPTMGGNKSIPMPSSLARYAVTYYASSLVRYKPSVFDLQIYPKQAYMFDAIARECALPMLLDTLSALEGADQIFNEQGAYRV